MSDLTDYGASLGVRFLMTDEAATRPAERWLALFSSAPSAAGGGVELTALGYARVEAVCTEGGSGTATNDDDLTFEADEDWPDIVAAAIMDAPIAGNMTHFKVLNPPVTVVAGQAFIVRAGALTVS